MRLMQRLKNAEKKAGVNGDPTVIFFKTIYEEKNGDVDFQTQRAIIIRADQSCETIDAGEHENDDQFRDRVGRVADYRESNGR